MTLEENLKYNLLKLAAGNKEREIELFLPYAYNVDRNAFILGCGKDTMMYLFARLTHIYYSKSLIRRVLLGQFLEVSASETGHTRFLQPIFKLIS